MNTIAVVQALTDEQVTALRAEHGWAKETIRAIEAALLAQLQSQESTAPCVACGYQHGHAIGCENNPVDIALAASPSQENTQPISDFPELQAMVKKGLEDGTLTPIGGSQENTAGSAAPRWPEGLLERVKAAEQRIADNCAPRRIPADPHGDVDLVLAEVRYLIEGNWPPFWIAPPPARGVTIHLGRDPASGEVLRVDPPAAREGVREQPVAHLRPITHPDWLEVCHQDEPGAFPVFAHGVGAVCPDSTKNRNGGRDA
jgi:hypothetical protein